MIKNGHSLRTPRGPEPPDVGFAHPEDPHATLEVLEVSKLRSKVLSDHSIFRPHRIGFFHLLVVTEGRGRHWVDFEGYDVAPATVLQVRPEQIQWYDPEGGFEALILLFTPTHEAVRLPRPRWPVRLDLPRADFGVLESLLRTLQAVEEGLVHSPRERIRRLLLPAVLEIVEGASLHHLDAGRGRQPLLDAFEALVERHHRRHRDLAWYSRRLGCSVRTLTRRCQQLTGRGAKRLLDERVVLEAKRRLISEATRIEELAESLGFSEATNFVKFFRRHTGRTPLAFRRDYEGLERPTDRALQSSSGQRVK